MTSLLRVEADEPWTEKDESELRENEARIEEGTLAAHAGLVVIRDKGLYRKTHRTFEAYCIERWGYSRSRAYRIIDVANVSKNLSQIWDKSKPEAPVSINEPQAKALKSLPAPQQREAFKKACEKTPSGKPTTRQVEEAVAEVKGIAPAAPTPNGHAEPIGSFNRPLPGQLSLLPEAEPEETDPDDAPGPWDKFFERMIEFFVSLPRRGGVRGLTQDWSAKKREASLVHLEKLHALTGQFIAELRGL
jgi:hypothetical protein